MESRFEGGGHFIHVENYRASQRCRHPHTSKLVNVSGTGIMLSIIYEYLI